MGYGLEMKCPKCGFEFFSRTGVGFSFPTVYEETVRKAKSGELGDEAQEFFKEHPDGAINATETDGKGGLFWHTQGSGKSLSMVFYAHRLQEALGHRTG